MDIVHAQENFRWGVKAFNSSNYNNAIQYFEKALSIKPENVPERVWLGKSLYKSGLEEAALNEWNLILGKGKGSALLENRVQVVRFRQGLWPDLSEEGKLVVSNVIDASTMSAHRITRPSSARGRKDGSLSVASFGSDEIYYLDSNNLVLSRFTGPIGGFQNPFDIVENNDGSFFVSEYSGNQVTKFDSNRNKMLSFGSKGIGPGQLLGPQYLALDGEGYLYVSDWGNKRINKYNLDGEFVFSFGGKGSTVPLLSGPTGIAVKDNVIFVGDRLKKRIACFDRDGNFLKFLGEESLNGPEGLLLYNRNALVIADTSTFAEGTRILELNLDTENLRVLMDLSKTAKRILNLSLSTNGEIIASDYDQNKILYLSDISSLYTSLFVQIETIDSAKYPEITMDISVEDRRGNPVLGLKKNNFRVTESSKPTGEIDLYQPVNSYDRFDCAIVVEKSLYMEKQKDNIKKALNTIIDNLGNHANIHVVTASDQAVLEAGPQDTRLEKINRAFNGIPTDMVRLGMALRLAGGKLVPSRLKKVILFLTTGEYNPFIFNDYSLMDITHFLKNNHICFYPVYLTQGIKNDDLEYIAEQTMGRNFGFFDKEGLLPLLSVLTSQKDSRYVVKFNSSTFNELGTNMIEVQAEVSLHKKTGRDESGYYGPIKNTNEKEQ
ncbi:MAG: VWA domain-containing protein [Spirochaetales bacterium]|nr:VWA domain-containing protein [Spirochaetales bacterium]